MTSLEDSNWRRTTFLNVVAVNAPSCRGLQFSVKVNGQEHRKWVGGQDQQALRRILEMRNACWRGYATTAKGILLQPLPPVAPSARSSTGYLGVYRSIRREKSGALSQCFQVRLRDLRDGRQSSRHFRLAHYLSDQAALRAAVCLLERNTAAYNAVVRRYNEVTLEEAWRLADEEVRTLRPQLQRIRKFSVERWSDAVQSVFGGNAPDPVDPGPPWNASPRDPEPKPLRRLISDPALWPTEHLLRLSHRIEEELAAREDHALERFEAGLKSAVSAYVSNQG